MASEDDPPRPEPESEASESPFGEGLGRAIKVLRALRDVSRKDLAELASVSYSYLAEIEGGTKQPSPQVLEALAKALGLSVSELVAEAEHWAAGDAESPEFPVDDDPEAYAPPEERSPRWRYAHAYRAAERMSPQRAPIAEAAPSGRRADPVKELLDLLARMRPEDRERVLDLARRLARR